jgi:hypothetical protein
MFYYPDFDDGLLGTPDRLVSLSSKWLSFTAVALAFWP